MSAEPVLRAKAKDEITKEKVLVYLRVVFIKVGEIDTVNEKFSADVFLQARWREPSLDGQKKNEECEMDPGAATWVPKLFVDNATSEPKNDMWYIVKFDHQGSATVFEKRRVKGNFFENMELNQFPFDTQDLSVVVSTERGENEVELNEDMEEVSTVNVKSFVDSQEWNLHSHIHSCKRKTTDVYCSSQHKHPAISISCRATRKAQFFIYNVILIMIFIGSLTFVTFGVDPSLSQNRIQLTFILILSNITFKFVVTQTLPKVAYLTYLDRYILVTMATMCVAAAWHAIVAKIHKDRGEDVANVADTIALICLAVFYVLFNIFFILYCMFLISARWRQFSQKDMEQKAKEKGQVIEDIKIHSFNEPVSQGHNNKVMDGQH